MCCVHVLHDDTRKDLHSQIRCESQDKKMAKELEGNPKDCKQLVWEMEKEPTKTTWSNFTGPERPKWDWRP